MMEMWCYILSSNAEGYLSSCGYYSDYDMNHIINRFLKMFKLRLFQNKWKFRYKYACVSWWNWYSYLNSLWWYFRQVKSLGCQYFALLFDDIEDELCSEDNSIFSSFADAQCGVTNDIFLYLGQPRLFLFCPTGMVLIYFIQLIYWSINCG